MGKDQMVPSGKYFHLPGIWNNRVGVGLGLGNNRETIENNALMASLDQPVLSGINTCGPQGGGELP